MQFLLTRPLRDVTEPLSHQTNNWRISTHTPLAGRDKLLELPVYRIQISTHTPLAGRDTIQSGASPSTFIFLLTRPLRDVTNY